MSKELNDDAQRFLRYLLSRDEILSSKDLYHEYFQRHDRRITPTMRGRVFSEYVRQKVIPIIISLTPLCSNKALTMSELLERASLPRDLAHLVANTLSHKREEYGLNYICVKEHIDRGRYCINKKL